MKKLLFIVLACSALSAVLANGQAESGRASVADVVNSNSYVASSYLDLEAVLDDYGYPYGVEEEKAVTFNFAPSFIASLPMGGAADIQIALKTNDRAFFGKSDINYVLFLNDSDLLENGDYAGAIESSLEGILRSKTGESRVYLYSVKDPDWDPVMGTGDLSRRIEGLRGERGAETMRDSRKDLEALLADLPESPLPYKILWAFDKPIAEKEKEFDDLFGIIAGLKDSDTEISFAGHSENFRVNTVNRVLDVFGGNSYYFSGPEDLGAVINDDFLYYCYPAVGELDIKIYSMADYNPAMISHRYYKSLGFDEEHTILTGLELPSRNAYMKGRDPGEEPLPGALVTISYFDHRAGEMRYLSKEISLVYTADYRFVMESRDPLVERNRTILATFELINAIPDMLRYNNYSDALVKIAEQIGALENLNRTLGDPMIAEDVEMLEKYRAIIYVNRDDVFKSVKLFGDLRKKDY